MAWGCGCCFRTKSGKAVVKQRRGVGGRFTQKFRTNASCIHRECVEAGCLLLLTQVAHVTGLGTVPAGRAAPVRKRGGLLLSSGSQRRANRHEDIPEQHQQGVVQHGYDCRCLIVLRILSPSRPPDAIQPRAVVIKCATGFYKVTRVPVRISRNLLIDR